MCALLSIDNMDGYLSFNRLLHGRRHGGKEEYLLLVEQADMNEIFDTETALRKTNMNNLQLCKEMISRMRIEKVSLIERGGTC